MNIYIYLLLTAVSIILLEDTTNKNIFIDIKQNHNHIDFLEKINITKKLTKEITNFNYLYKDKRFNCKIINNFDGYQIKLPNKIFLLDCNTKSYIKIIKCSNMNCKFIITPYLSYRCYPYYLCKTYFFNKISGILHVK